MVWTHIVTGLKFFLTECCESPFLQSAVNLLSYRGLWISFLTECCESPFLQSAVNLLSYRVLWISFLTEARESPFLQSAVNLLSYRVLWISFLKECCESPFLKSAVNLLSYRVLWISFLTECCESPFLKGAVNLLSYRVLWISFQDSQLLQSHPRVWTLMFCNVYLQTDYKLTHFIRRVHVNKDKRLFCMSVRLYVRMSERGAQWPDFGEIWFLRL